MPRSSLLLLLCRLRDFLMIEVVAHHGRLAEGRTVLVVVPDIQHAFLCRIFPDLLIQLRPVGAAFLRIDLMIQLVQLRMMLVDPVEDALFVIPAEVQVFQPHQVALALGPLDDLDHVRDAGEDRRDEAGGLDARLVKLAHGLQPALDADGAVHLFPEILVQRVDRPGHMGAGELFDQVQVAQDQVGFRGDADADPGGQQLLQQLAGASVFLLQRLIGVRHRAEESFLPGVLTRFIDRRPVFDVHKLAPGLRMIGKALHEGSVAVFAGMGTAHIRIDRKIRYRQVGFRHDVFDFDFLNDHFSS